MIHNQVKPKAGARGEPQVRSSDGLGIPQPLPQMKCGKCGSVNMKDTGSFMVTIYQCQDCGERHCEDSGDAGWDA